PIPWSSTSSCNHRHRSMETRRMLRFTAVVGSAVMVVATSSMAGRVTGHGKWSAEERATLTSLTLDKLEPLPADPSNRVADDTTAARLGRQLFFDVKLSSNGKVSCAKCHLPDRDF